MLGSVQQVRMAERSKAPDSSANLLTNSERAFWSSSEGVGSNPTSDKNFFSSNYSGETFYILINIRKDFFVNSNRLSDLLFTATISAYKSII